MSGICELKQRGETIRRVLVWAAAIDAAPSVIPAKAGMQLSRNTGPPAGAADDTERRGRLRLIRVVHHEVGKVTLLLVSARGSDIALPIAFFAAIDIVR